jgi:hypothetical protein
MPSFVRYIGIDYSGAQTPTASLKGLRVYMAEGGAPPVEVPPRPSPRKYTRRGIAEWLGSRACRNGNWKMVSRDWRRKATSPDPRVRNLPVRDSGAPA